MTKPAPVKRGRPRLYDQDTERSMVMDSAIRVMAAKGYREMSVNDVLADAGLSTTSFYRHFDSKEALLRATLLREANRVADGVQRAVDAAGDPVEAVDAWLEAVLDTFFEPKRVARSAVFTRNALRDFPLAQEMAPIYQIIAEPLARVLRAGNRAGVLHSANPKADALTLYALVTTAAYSLRGTLRSRAAVRDHVLRFGGPALGLGPPAGTSRAARP